MPVMKFNFESVLTSHSNVYFGQITIPANTTDTVTLNFKTPCNRFIAIHLAKSGSTRYVQTGQIVEPKDAYAWGLDFPFNCNWYASGAADDGGITWSEDHKSISLKQPRNYYYGEWLYFAFWAD